MEVLEVEVVHLVVSPAHAYEGRPADGPTEVATSDLEEVEVVAGKGVRGDRFFARRAHSTSAVTLIALEGLRDMAREIGLGEPDPLLARRTVVLGGVSAAQVHALAGREFALGGIGFRGGRPASPCAWMDVVYAPGAFRAMRGRGGLRCAPTTSGVLRRGTTTLTLP
ncbi:hypothetical protein EV189_2232 [Motilibacter rhizosphaerae]|uniref:MOSC domain-containing protein n=1 Tax=Motilibacter rhizosphaerae TaxID=598652 RepID=A0A4Q7NPC6_9ACTN|nr:molybdenum cofactor biosysynthesis protein [Motilibacter rhizosphaerae]RZS86816.1 hypothetical protein EV189_2232 [Motilibacter rhizosphaerae]